MYNETLSPNASFVFKFDNGVLYYKPSSVFWYMLHTKLGHIMVSKAHILPLNLLILFQLPWIPCSLSAPSRVFPLGYSGAGRLAQICSRMYINSTQSTAPPLRRPSLLLCPNHTHLHRTSGASDLFMSACLTALTLYSLTIRALGASCSHLPSPLQYTEQKHPHG